MLVISLKKCCDFLPFSVFPSNFVLEIKAITFSEKLSFLKHIIIQYLISLFFEHIKLKINT